MKKWKLFLSDDGFIIGDLNGFNPNHFSHYSKILAGVCFDEIIKADIIMLVDTTIRLQMITDALVEPLIVASLIMVSFQSF